MDISLILYGAFLGLLFAGAAYKQGLLGTIGEGAFNTIKGIFVVIVGGIFGAVLTYQGVTVTLDSIVQMFTIISFAGFGVIWAIDWLVTMIVNLMGSKSSLAQGMAVPKR